MEKSFLVERPLLVENFLDKGKIFACDNFLDEGKNFSCGKIIGLRLLKTKSCNKTNTKDETIKIYDLE